MSRKKVTRREIIKKTTIGVGAVAATPLLAKEVDSKVKRRSTQVTIMLDAGAFLTDEEKNGFLYSEVGYFNPEIIIFGDGEEVARIDQDLIGTTGRVVEIRHTNKRGEDLGRGIKFSQNLIKNLLRLHTLYGGRIYPVSLNMYHCIFHFNSGHFWGSKIKKRHFREFDARTGEWTGKRELYGPIAHDIGISFELEKGEALKFVSEGQELWSTAAYAGQFRRFDIELPADNSTADLYYRDAIKLGEANYWLPNQGGDPPPTWTHGGPGGGGG